MSDDLELTVYDRAELEALRSIHEGTQAREKQSRYKLAAAVSFATFGASIALIAGTGVLGVVAVASLVSGFYSMVRATE